MAVTGVGAAVAIPRSYTEAFDESRRLAMFLADLALIVTPVIILCATWVAATLWRVRSFLRQAVTWLLVGTATTWVLTAASSAIDFLALVDEQLSTTETLRLLLPLIAPVEVWTIPTYVAPWSGIAFAVWAVHRINLSLKS